MKLQPVPMSKLTEQRAKAPGVVADCSKGDRGLRDPTAGLLSPGSRSISTGTVEETAWLDPEGFCQYCPGVLWWSLAFSLRAGGGGQGSS